MRNEALRDWPPPDPVLRLEGVSKTFVLRGGAKVEAVRNVHLEVFPGETVALVGESGSGKSTLARIALALCEPDSGRVLLDGHDLRSLPKDALRRRRTAMQPVFQDSYAAFNPRRTVRQILAQALDCRADMDLDETQECVSVLDRVGLTPGASYLERFPHELSGGQRQRLGIARALAARPRIIVADEPLSGADVSIRGQILNLLLDLRRSENLSMLFITHDISIAEAFTDRVVIMYRGAVVEEGPSSEVLADPAHPYTKLLKSAVPSIDAETVRIQSWPGQARSMGKGCAFYHRCPEAFDRCPIEEPRLFRASATRTCACFHSENGLPQRPTEEDLSPLKLAHRGS